MIKQFYSAIMQREREIFASKLERGKIKVILLSKKLYVPLRSYFYCLNERNICDNNKMWKKGWSIIIEKNCFKWEDNIVSGD